MFDNLKKKFMFINMVTISFVMIISFAIIFISNYTTIKNENSIRLKNASIIPTRLSGMIRGYAIIAEDPISPNEFSLSFNIILNKAGEVEEVFSRIALEENDYKAIAKMINLRGKKTSTIKFAGRKWLYNKEELQSKRFRLNSINHQNQDLYQLTLLDITESTSSLINLGITLGVLSVIMLVVIYFISRYFSDKAIEPTKKIWDKQCQFIADASHELKTPLTTIAANVDVLLANETSTIKKEKKWINYIKCENERMNKLVSNLLYLAKSDESDLNLAMESVNVSALLKETILTVEARLFDRGIKLKNNVEKNINFETNYDSLKQIILVLIDNAIKYVNEGGSIDVSLYTNNQFIILKVTNTGSGINPDKLDKIFDRFYREDETRNGSDQSYGLGLSIASSLVKKLGGTIEVESEINKSTTFTLNFKKK